jgi:hypothetical protein
MSQRRIYRKRWGLFRNPNIRREIDALDADRDYEHIVYLLSCYEFPFDVTRSLEMALFHTYGSVPVSRLLDATGEFTDQGQKRYDDTRLLIAHFMQDGLDSVTGARSIRRMNSTHGMFRIPNDDFLFVLSTFVTYPFDWIAKWGWRRLTDHERIAWFNFFRELGHRMGLSNVPDSFPAMQEFLKRYEAQHLVYAPANRRVADATVRIFENWFPIRLRGLVEPVVRALIKAELRRTFGYPEAPVWLGAMLHNTMRIRAWCTRWFAIEAYPKTIANSLNRTYPNNHYAIDALVPTYVEQVDGQEIRVHDFS